MGNSHFCCHFKWIESLGLDGCERAGAFRIMHTTIGTVTTPEFLGANTALHHLAGFACHDALVLVRL